MNISHVSGFGRCRSRLRSRAKKTLNVQRPISNSQNPMHRKRLTMRECDSLCGFAPGAKNEAADGEAEEWAAHIDANERPRICLERREHANGRVFNKEKR